MTWTWPLHRRVTYAPLARELTHHDDRLRRSLLFLCYLCAVTYSLAALWPLITPLNQYGDSRLNLFYGASWVAVWQQLARVEAAAQRERQRVTQPQPRSQTNSSTASAPSCDSKTPRRVCAAADLRSGATPSLVWFLHFQKAGGSSFSLLATHNGMVSSQVARSGSPKHTTPWVLLPLLRVARRPGNADFVPYFQGQLELSAEAQRSLVEAELRNGTSFVSSEFGFPARPLPPQPVVYVTVLREPVARAVSQFWYHRGTLSACSFFEVLHEEESPCAVRNKTAGRGSMFNGYNFYVDMLNGRRSHIAAVASWRDRYRPKLAEAARLESARRKLSELFSVVLLLEVPATWRLLERVLGWRHAELGRSNANGHPRDDALLRAWRTDWREELCRRNALDVQLYRFAHELAATRLKEAGEGMLAAQVAAMPPATDATCTYGVRV